MPIIDGFQEFRYLFAVWPGPSLLWIWEDAARWLRWWLGHRADSNRRETGLARAPAPGGSCGSSGLGQHWQRAVHRLGAGKELCQIGIVRNQIRRGCAPVLFSANTALQLRKALLAPQVVTASRCRFLFHFGRMRCVKWSAHERSESAPRSHNGKRTPDTASLYNRW